MLNGRGTGQAMEPAQIREIAENHKTEYILCTQLAERIEESFNFKLPIDEIVLLTMFLRYRAPSVDNTPKPVLLYAMHGDGVATALARAVNAAARLENTFAAEIPLGGDHSLLYPVLKAQIEQIDRGGGVLVLYDADFLAGVYSSIGLETGISLRTLKMPITTAGFEFSRKAAAQRDVDALHRELSADVRGFLTAKKPVIITLCTTGKGGALQLKQYVERYGDADAFEVIPLAIREEAQLKGEIAAILNETNIHCVVGTHDPQLFGIPFIPISDVFSVEPHRLPELIKRQQTKEKQRGQVDYEAIYAYLREQLEHVEITKLQKLLPIALTHINSEMAELSFDAEIGLMIHLACAINRISAGETPPVSLQREQVIARNRDGYRILRGIVRPLERAFKVIFNDDELASLLIIIYKI
jgi:transcriptional regulatory protein LevR